jgi:methyltransferase
MNTAPPVGALVAFLGVVIAERMAELVISARTRRTLIARGAVERGRGHFRWFVVAHALFPFALVLEVMELGARPGRFAAAWLALWLGAQMLRAAAILALGDRWNVRVLVPPGEPPVVRGPYRWMKHPNYLAVLVESVAGPMTFGAWRTAIGFAAAQVVLFAIRIPCEERALAAAAGTAAPAATAPTTPPSPAAD